MLRAMACLLGRHVWSPHPDFKIVRFRRCDRCGRVEDDFPADGRWFRRRDLEEAK